ncbi:MAG: DEAD/DEAH box helicase [Gemmataceae bacterium]
MESPVPTPSEPDLTSSSVDLPSDSDADLAWPSDEPAEAAPPPDVPPEERPADGPKVAYASMKLIAPLMDAIRHAKYEYATPVQASVIPKAMRGVDVIGQAQTGTGKTAAFLIPFLNRWRPHKLKGPIGLVMCPTRELALQVATEAEKLAPSRHFRTVAVYGGARMGKQIEGLSRGCDLVVGTPGRMLDHMRRGNMNLSDVRYVVLDEADRMLDIGFRPDIERILRNCPSERQTLLMSATVPDTIKRLVNRYMHHPVHLNLSPGVLTVDKIRQTYITVDEDRKFELLVKVLHREKPRQCLIFVERKRSADRLYDKLKGHFKGVSVIHGDLPQSHRERIMGGFRAEKVHVLIATDVASRGIDVTGISHVINYDLPMDIENYVHRIGRTGRIGRDGVAISFATPEQGGHLTDIEMTINRLIDEDRIEGFESYTPRKRYDAPPQPVGGSGEQQPAEAAPQPEKKAVFGKFTRKYSSRL